MRLFQMIIVDDEPMICSGLMKNIDWGNLGFAYIQTDKRYVSNYKDGAWDECTLTEDATVQITECAGVLQYAQTVFEGLKQSNLFLCNTDTYD